MGAARAGYMLALLLAFGLWLANGTAFSWIWLCVLLAVPPGCLALSLRAMVSFSMKPGGTRNLVMGHRGQIMLLGKSIYPMPPFRGKLRLRDDMTGKCRWYDPAPGVPTEHCGGFRAELVRGRVTDYLGLWAFPKGFAEPLEITVLPKPVPIASLPDFENPPIRRYIPGGDSPEEYELMPYRRGDSPKSLHWKLSFKTGHPIVRRLQKPELMTLTVDLIARGSREELDRRYGQILWLGRHLLSKDIPWRLRVLTGKGVQIDSIESEAALLQALTAALHCPVAAAGAELPAVDGWHYMPEDSP